MRSPLPNEFALQIPSVADGTRPNTQFGTSITPATGSHGSYASLISGAITSMAARSRIGV